MNADSQQYWDRHAATFDDAPDHGLRDPAIRHAWTDLLVACMPTAPAVVVDLGCGTGSLAVLLAHAGYDVRGLDVSPRMIDIARQKAATAKVSVPFERGDAAAPGYLPGCCDVILARHVLWALPDPDAALARWVPLLKPGGRLILIEGRWSTGAGISARDCQTLVLRHRETTSVRRLNDAALWGEAIADERYLLLSVD